MAFTSWRGVVGCIKPTLRPGGLEELIRMLPEGIGVLPLFLNISKGTTDEFKRAVAPYEPLLQQLADAGCDLIHPEGAPPFMLLGYKGERDLMRKWEKTYGVPMFTPGQNHARAMKAMKITRAINIAYTTWDDGNLVKSYYAGAGIDMLSREVFPVPFQGVQELSSKEVYAFIKKAVGKYKRLDGIYIQGGAWRVLDILEPLEQDLGIPVVHPGPAKAWEVMRRLHVNAPMGGYGRLLAEMPDG
jgi:maleate isomerase